MCAWIVYFWAAEAVFYIRVRVCWCLSSRRRCGVMCLMITMAMVIVWGEGAREGREHRRGWQGWRIKNGHVDEDEQAQEKRGGASGRSPSAVPLRPSGVEWSGVEEQPTSLLA